MSDDAALLRRYAEDRSEPAFTELVRRHVDLVYGAALRRVGGDTHAAADVVQQVFTSVARDARKLAAHPVFSAWLHAATRNAAVNLMISNRRRRERETEAVARAAIDTSPAANWEQVRPLLDAAIDELPESDRAAVVLRFLERRAFADVGARLHVSEDAARVRTDRALEKLRVALARRGVTSSAAALGALVSAQPLVSAPAGLAANVAAQAMAATPVLMTFLTTMTTKSLALGALGAAIVFVAGFYIGQARAPDALPVAVAADAPTASQLKALQQENDRLRLEASAQSARLMQLTDANAKLEAHAAEIQPRKPLALGMSRGDIQEAVINNLRQIAAARDQFHLENGRPADNLATLVGRKAYIKRMLIVDGEDYSALSMDPKAPLTVQTPGGLAITFDPSGEGTTKPEFTPEEQAERAEQERMNQIMRTAQKAADAYRAAHNGEKVPNQQAILPYFANPKDAADYIEFLEAHKPAKK